MLSLKNKQVSFAVDPEHGSNLVSLKYKNQELIYTDKKFLKAHGFTGGYVLWPFPNRVRNKKYIFNGQKYSLKNLPETAWYHHAFARSCRWQFRKTKNKITTWLEITPKFRYWTCFPWHSRLTLVYSLLAKGVKIEYQVENLDQTELGFGFGLHPLFKNALAIKIPAKYVMKSDKDLLPTGKLLPASLDKLTPVKDLNLDHVFTYLTGSQVVQFSGGLKLAISTSPDFTHCVVYTGEKDQFTSVESQTCSTDAHNLDALGFKKESHLIRIKPGKSHKGWVRYSVIE